MRFKGIFMMYHPDLNTDSNSLNESRYPKGRTRLYRRGRCHGDWNLEKTNGGANFTDIRIDYKSKKIGNELGITWNKDISGDQDNDLCIAVRTLVKKIKGELSGDTADSKNKLLYNIALANNIKVPDKRRPSDVKQATIVKPPTPKPIVYVEPKPIVYVEPKPIVYVEPKPIVYVEPKPIVYVEPKPIVYDEPEPIVYDEPKPIVYVEPLPDLVDPLPLPNVIVEEPNIELVIEDIKKPEITPQIKNISETTHTTLTVKEGKQILNILKTRPEINLFSDDITKILLHYCDRCAKDQIQVALSYITINNRLELLDELINKKYQELNDEKTKILCGSELNMIFRKFDE
jgi:hypothetical protein